MEIETAYAQLIFDQLKFQLPKLLMNEFNFKIDWVENECLCPVKAIYVSPPVNVQVIDQEIYIDQLT